MKTNFNFVSNLFNKAEQTDNVVNNLQVNAYKVRINDNTVYIEAVCVNEYSGVYGTGDVRTIAPSKKQLNRLQRMDSLFVYED